MKKIYIRIISTGKMYAYEACDPKGEPLHLKPNQSVLVENDQIVEEGKILEKPKIITGIEDGTGVILRVLNDEDRQWCRELKTQACQYTKEVQKKVLRHGLNMKILDADFSFDQKKLTFYFSANGRVDFRGLVLDVYKSFGKLIRLQQVGARDEAKHFACIGKCGRELCCAKFLNNTETITMEMAQAQISSAGVNKLSGCCGKLMCCLSYEGGNYPACAGEQSRAEADKNCKK